MASRKRHLKVLQLLGELPVARLQLPHRLRLILCELHLEAAEAGVEAVDARLQCRAAVLQ